MSRWDTISASVWRALDWAAQERWRAVLAILAVGLIVVLPGLAALPVTDRDEARFAQASKQMLETGDLIDIRFQDQPRWKKPVGIYWLQAASASVLSDGVAAPIWAYRVPSAIGVLLAALATWWGARAIMAARPALLAGLMLSTATLVAAEGHIAKTDAALMASAAVALGALIRLLHGRGGAGTSLIFWLAIAASILLKGPIVPVIVVLSLAGVWIAQRRAPAFGSLRAGWGLALVAILVAPWLIAIWHVSDGAFFAEALGRDLGAKMTSGQEKHWGPPGLYLALVWVTYWPWAALLPAAVHRLWAERRAGWLILLAAWVVPFWLVLEAVPTKLPHYVLPLYPALAMAVGAAASGFDDAPRWARRAAAALIVIPGIGLALANIALPAILEARIVWPAAVLSLAGAGAAILAARGALAGRSGLLVGGALAAALVLFPATLRHALPALDTGFASPRLAAAVAPWRACASGPVHSVGYHEPSLVFLTETGTKLGRADEALAALRTDPGALVLIEDRWRRTLGRKVPDGLIVRARVAYFNYNRGRFQSADLVTQDHPRWAACAAAG